MSETLDERQLAERNARVAASNRAFGRALSIGGAALAALGLLILLGGGVALTILDGVQDGDARAIEETASSIMATMMLAPGILALLAMCGLVAGEQVRRGSISRNPNAPDTLLPSASHVSRFRVLSLGWHGFWVGVGLLVSFVLVGLPVISWFTGGWPEDVKEQFAFGGLWIIYGALAAGVTFAAATSLFKKVVYLRAVASGRATPAGGKGRAFWRLVDFRWRFDLWLAGLGGCCVALSVTFLDGAVGPGNYPDETAAALAPFLAVLGLGVVLTVAGAWASAQLWRSGESLGSGESFA